MLTPAKRRVSSTELVQQHRLFGRENSDQGSSKLSWTG
jgi:hypothetical protein